jgi:hypothetical protein
VVKFDRRAELDALIEELTEAFTVRYEKPPSAEQLEALDRMQAANIDPSIISGLIAFNYQKRLHDLATPSWLVGTFVAISMQIHGCPQMRLKGCLLSRTKSTAKRLPGSIIRLGSRTEFRGKISVGNVVPRHSAKDIIVG